MIEIEKMDTPDGSSSAIAGAQSRQAAASSGKQRRAAVTEVAMWQGDWPGDSDCGDPQRTE
jgi:hypothetical protein